MEDTTYSLLCERLERGLWRNVLISVNIDEPKDTHLFILQLQSYCPPTKNRVTIFQRVNKSQSVTQVVSFSSSDESWLISFCTSVFVLWNIDEERTILTKSEVVIKQNLNKQANKRQVLDYSVITLSQLEQDRNRSNSKSHRVCHLQNNTSVKGILRK